MNGQMNFLDYMKSLEPQEEKKVEVQETKVICQFSKHECNKEELWKVADSLDALMCPHVCCRKCTTVGCGARCNGSPEPKKREVVLCEGCGVEFGSLSCFEKRGYQYDRA